MQLKYAKMLAIVVHENMKLGDNTLNNERLSLVNTKFLTICSPHFAALRYIKKPPSFPECCFEN